MEPFLIIFFRFQLFKLLRFLNEVETNEQQMFSSVTESQQNLTELSLADSGTGMSEEDQSGDTTHFRDDVIDYTAAVRHAPRINYVQDLPRDVTPVREGSANRCAAQVHESPRIVINTKRATSGVKRPGFKLKSPKKSSPLKSNAVTSSGLNPFREEGASAKSSSDTASSTTTTASRRPPRSSRANRRSNANMTTFKPAASTSTPHA